MEAVAWTAIGLMAATLGALTTALLRLGGRVDALCASLKSRIDALAARIGALDCRLTARVDALAGRIGEHIERHTG